MEHLQVLNWLFFIAVVCVILALDLGLFHRAKNQSYTSHFTTKQSILHILLIAITSLCFSLLIYYTNGSKDALDFVTCYFLEISLSMDNLFVFLLIFKYMKITERYQRKVLFWGVMGALILRLIFIYFGFFLVHNWDWIFYLFGIILIYGAYKIAFQNHLATLETADISSNIFLRIMRKFLRITEDAGSGDFFIRNPKDGLIYATYTFVALLLIEKTDLLFAIESITASLSISNNFFVVFTSNIFAVIGLRSMYFFISSLFKRFKSLHYSLAMIFVFIGSKMILALHGVHINTIASLCFILAVIGIVCAFDIISEKYIK